MTVEHVSPIDQFAGEGEFDRRVRLRFSELVHLDLYRFLARIPPHRFQDFVACAVQFYVQHRGMPPTSLAIENAQVVMPAPEDFTTPRTPTKLKGVARSKAASAPPPPPPVRDVAASSLDQEETSFMQKVGAGAGLGGLTL